MLSNLLSETEPNILAVVTPRVWASRNSRSRSVAWARGAKDRAPSTELPQRALPLDSLPSGTEPTYPTLIQQAKANMDRSLHCVVTPRVGSFYEARVLLTPLS